MASSDRKNYSINVDLLHELDKYDFRVWISSNPYTLDFRNSNFDGEGSPILSLFWEYRKDRWCMHISLLDGSREKLFDNVTTENLLSEIGVHLRKEGFELVLTGVPI